MPCQKKQHQKIRMQNFFSHKCYCQTILKTHANYIYFVSRRYYYIWKENIFTTIRSFPYAAFNARYNIFADGIFVFVFVTRICRILISLNWNTFFPNLIIKQKCDRNTGMMWLNYQNKNNIFGELFISAHILLTIAHYSLSQCIWF